MTAVRRRLTGPQAGASGSPTVPSFVAYAIAVVGPLGVLLFRLALDRLTTNPTTHSVSPLLILYVFPIAAAASLHWRTGLLATIVSSAAGGYYLLGSSPANGLPPGQTLNLVFLLIVGLVATALLERLRRADSALRTANQTLESRVAARTGALTEATLALARQEERYHSLFDHMLETLLHGRLIFEGGRAVDVEVLTVNRSYVETMGLGDPTGRRMSEVTPGFAERDRELCDAAVRVTQTGKPEQREYRSWRTGRWLALSIFKLNENEFAIVSQDITPRKQIDETRNLLARIVESSEDAIVTMNLEGVVTSWNASAERLFGYTAVEVIGRALRELTVPDAHRGELAEMLARITRGESIRDFETERRTKGGSSLTVSISASPMTDASGKVIGVASIARDVTEELRSRQTAKVRAERQEFRRRVSAAFAAAASSDLHALLTVIAEATVGHLADGCVIWVLDGNDVLRQLAVSARDGNMQARMRRQPLDLPLGSTAPPAKTVRDGRARLLQSAEIAEYLADLPDELRPLFTELDIRSLILVPLRVGAAIVGVIALRLGPGPRTFTDEDLAVAVDLAERAALAVKNARLQEHADNAFRERLKAEERAREEERRFRQVVENIDEVFWLTDPTKSQLLYVSPAYQRMFGRDPSVGTDAEAGWLAAIHPDDRARVIDSFARQASGNYNETYRIVRPDGSIRWIRGRAFPVCDESGAVVRIAGLAEDITDRRRLEIQFQQAQKMEAIGQLASGIAHDFNNLLTAIHGFATLALRALDPNPLGEELSEIIHASTRAAALTKQLLLFSRRQSMQPVTLDLNEVVESITRMLQRLIGEQVSLQLKLTPALPPVDADQGMLEQALVNLAVNARDAMPAGGVLTISTAVEELDTAAVVTFPGLAAGTTVVLTVKDTGAGIAPEALTHIFEPFFTTKEVGKGSGLGLASVYGVVKQHNGWISVTSTPGEGAAFTIRLPASRTAAKPVADAPSRRQQPIGTGTVLIAEDDPSVRSLTSQVLGRAGFTVLAAASGVEALDLWKQADGRAQLLLTDIVMPGGVNGLELARRLRADCPQLKVIYSTGYSSELRGGTDLLDDNTRILQKPYEAASMLLLVDEILGRRQRQADPDAPAA